VSDIIGITPFEHVDAGLVAAVCRAGALGVLDLGCRPEAASAALAKLARQGVKDFGVRVGEGVEVLPQPLPEGVRTVVVGAGADLGRWRPRSVLVQVTSIEEAREAARAGADGLIAKGSESGGRVGEETSLVLLQRIARELSLPIWVQGGVGLHTAAACLAGGARGVVLDSQLALVRESSLPESVRAAVAGMDGSETAVVGGYRILSRPDLPSANAKEAALGDIAAKLGASDLRRFLLPAGQDTAFARPFAEQFRTAGGVVGALRRAIAGHLRQAKELRPLAPGAAFAADHGIRYPIAQGPMTRVSDRAAFADAVSRAGGLPFLALALMRGDEVRELLRETASRLGDRAWGVGILGFVPREIREEQLAILREIRPPVALVAGGRPSQVRPLEAQGTTSYLHVPSPGLLDLFLADGARRFVFEGRECGGHVGPRTSFVLWEQQIERLLAFEAPHELSVLFAGGVHDARSAAMVATMAAPLTAAGAKVGVLMGTAYLFTQEAVATGAIQPGFQEAARECDRTVLLETAPGHATRCLDTEYVRTFLAEKCRLEEQGWEAQEVWGALEKLNLGRLRIASKGLKREGDRLVSVDEAAQRRDGMYLIGQVAALRSQAVSTADLHAEVTEGATQILERLEIPGTAVEASARAGIAERAEVAIIGIACIFPGAPDRHAFWSNIVSGVDSIAEVPPERWDQDLYYDPAGTGEKSRSKWGGFLPPTPFDPLSYGIPPRSLAAIEPVQLLALEVARRALEDAGYRDRPFDREHTSVIFGAEAGTDLSNAYGFRALYPQYLGRIPKALDEHLPKLTEDSFPRRDRRAEGGVEEPAIAGRRPGEAGDASRRKVIVGAVSHHVVVRRCGRRTNRGVITCRVMRVHFGVTMAEMHHEHSDTPTS
jgi:NAD(P)H-dependent flavin oxidoreductase YrpB (nitropropane dioxygenase family)